jgi:hypothetical protein
MITNIRVRTREHVEMAAIIGSGVYVAYVYNRTGNVVVLAEERKMAIERNPKDEIKAKHPEAIRDGFKIGIVI